MKLVTFMGPGQAPLAGVVEADQVFSLAPAGYGSALEVIEQGEGAKARIAAYLKSAPRQAAIPLERAVLLAPLPRPPKFICVGLNYRDHAAEAKMEIPAVPTIFSKFHNAVIGPGASIVLPKNSSKPDYEAEFAFVIGAGGRHIRPEDWPKHVWGYTCVNDVSARDFQLATSQWLMGKTFDTFAPMGPWIVSADEIADPHNLAISCTVNGEKLQNSNTRELIFGIGPLLEFLSSVMTLEPGDIITSGTPGGVALFRQGPGEWFLKPGDVVEARIEKLGFIRNRIV